MAQEVTIRTLCDQHLTEDSEQVDGQVYRLGVQLPNQSWEWMEADLCPAHAGGLSDLALTFTKYGRAFKATRDIVEKRQRGPAKTANSDRQAFKCDDCGRSFPKAQGLSMHRRRAHLDSAFDK